ncbi:hypothetical protein DF038_18805 [Burkholderia cepacia]|nr:hypothetical protein DF038_18805 [Burkholderia cepacia]
MVDSFRQTLARFGAGAGGSRNIFGRSRSADPPLACPTQSAERGHDLPHRVLLALHRQPSVPVGKIASETLTLICVKGFQGGSARRMGGEGSHM